MHRKYIIKTLSLIIFLISISACEQVSQNANSENIDLSEKVYPLLDAANSRWFYFASACRPFGMVTLNPDTQVGGAWGSGYRYDTDTIKGISHIHGWQISGVSVMPVSNSSSPNISEDYFSGFSHDSEVVQVGYHKVLLDRFDITTEMTSTKRVGFHRITFDESEDNGMVFKLAGRLGPCSMKEGKLEIKGKRKIYGELKNTPTRRRPKDFKVFFVVEYDKDISKISGGEGENAVVHFEKFDSPMLMKVGLSYTSHENAEKNIATELPGWDFEEVVAASKTEWNEWLSRIRIKDDNEEQVRRFYTDLWHGLQGRRTISDINGAYPDYTGAEFRIGQLPIGPNGKPMFDHYNSDSFWGAQWTINTMWGLFYPEIYSKMVRSMMVYYKDGGIVPRGPSGGNYTYVMTGASSTPFIVSAFQKGIEIGDHEEVYQALKKNHMAGGIMSKAGYEHETAKGGGLKHYLEMGYVPYPNPDGNFGYHQDGASLTLEYAYQDYTLAQMAKALDKKEDYQYFLERSQNYQNVFDVQSGWIRPKDVNGKWKSDFDPYQYEHGFNEANGAQGTWFVGHDIKGLAELMGGPEQAIKKLEAQFNEASKRNFTAGTSHERGEDPSLARIPINYGNQPSIQTAYIFQELSRADLTQYWTSEIMSKTFGGLTPYTGYNGDEDQGLMGSLAVIMKLGLFQMDGGTSADPKYLLSTPLFREVDITLPNGNELQISKEGEGVYIDRVIFNGAEVPGLSLTHSELIQGGHLVYKMK